MSPGLLSCGPAIRCASLRYADGSAPRTAAITAQEGNVERQTPIAAGENFGATSAGSAAAGARREWYADRGFTKSYKVGRTIVLREA